MKRHDDLKQKGQEKQAESAPNIDNPLANMLRMTIINNVCSADASYQFTREVQMVEMDDGVKLETFIWKPVGKGPWPTAFTRGPYPDMMESIQIPQAEEFAKRGIAYVYQNCRGKGGSEGIYVANVDERRDGIASLNWLNAQDWVASIGMHGQSYQAFTTWVVGDCLPPKVKALHVQFYGVLRNLSVSHSGLTAVDNICAWTMQNCTDTYSYDHYIKSAQYLPQIQVDEALWGGKVEGYSDWVNHPDFTDPYWQEGIWGELARAIGKIKVPVAVVGGYFDHHYEGTLEGWNRLSGETKAKSRLVLGPWTHFSTHGAPWKGGSHWPCTATSFDWFYSILVKGTIPATGIDAYVVGEDKWLHLDEFPLKANRTLQYFFTAEPIDTNRKATALSVVKPAEQSIFPYTYDPSDPKWAEGGECFLTSCEKIPDSQYSTGDLRGSHELSAPGYRQDVISFVSPPLEGAVTLAGSLNAALFVSSDAEDTAFTYTISEVDENGTAHNIRNGLLTLAYRHNRYASPVNDYRPGQVVELSIESLPIVWRVDAGHRIRVDISSSNFPEFSNHTNTVGNWAEQTKYQIAHQTIFAGGSYASAITLPIL